MTLRAIAALACLVMIVGAESTSAADLKAGVIAGFIGPETCQAWHASDRDSSENAVKVNWVLGFVYGRAAARKRDFPVPVQTTDIWDRVDRKCRRDPWKQIGTVAYEIERDLLAKR